MSSLENTRTIKVKGAHAEVGERASGLAQHAGGLLLVAVFVSLQEHICVVTVWPGKFSHVACLAPECIQYDHMKLTTTYGTKRVLIVRLGGGEAAIYYQFSSRDI